MVEETTRRLPSWMLSGAAAATATADPDKKKKKKKKQKKEQEEEEEEEEEEEDPEEEEGEEEENSNSLRNSRFSVRKSCQSKRSTSSRKGIPPFTENEDTVPNNKKVCRKRKSKVIAAAPAPAPAPECSQDDSGLTVEDLVSIAKEYIQGNKLSGQKHLANNEHELQIDLPATDPAVNPCEQSLVAHEKKDRSPSGEKQSFVSFSRSGDPAQDMLVLLLGPLLNKPAEEEKRPEFVAEDNASFRNLENQSQDDIREEIVPLVKKKTSLKSKSFTRRMRAVGL